MSENDETPRDRSRDNRRDQQRGRPRGKSSHKSDDKSRKKSNDYGRKPGRQTGDEPYRKKELGRGGTRGAGRSDRGGAKREFTEAERLEHSLRPVREKHTDPEIPEDVQVSELHPGARNELKTLDKELAETVAKHLVMVSRLIDDDPELANQHAISAMRKAGRIPVTRETYAVTSYVLGDYATALRELRTYRRLSGSELQLALMLDCERALGRPEKALETAREVDLKKLPVDQQVQVAIALSGARLDLGQPLQALYELDIAQLDPTKAFSWSPELFASYANVLEDLGRFEEAETWRERALLAEKALEEKTDTNDNYDSVEVFEIIEEEV